MFACGEARSSRELLTAVPYRGREIIREPVGTISMARKRPAAEPQDGIASTPAAQHESVSRCTCV
jgi:hypothetical protein